MAPSMAHNAIRTNSTIRPIGRSADILKGARRTTLNLLANNTQSKHSMLRLNCPSVWWRNRPLAVLCMKAVVHDYIVMSSDNAGNLHAYYIHYYVNIRYQVHFLQWQWVRWGDSRIVEQVEVTRVWISRSLTPNAKFFFDCLDSLVYVLKKR
jgi:hypothetical protein